MILVDTSVIVAWLDPRHASHDACTRALEGCAAVDELAVSVLTVAALAASGRGKAALDRDLHGFLRIAPDERVAFKAGQAFAKSYFRKGVNAALLVDAVIWQQAAALRIPILTLEPGKRKIAPDVEVFQPIAKG